MEKRIRVTICCGTACYVLGGSELLELADGLPEALKRRVDIDGSPCLGLCKGKLAAERPFALVDGAEVAGATLSSLIDAIASRASALDAGTLS
jgi:NADH:ubiquinone oxidoreductase subunit E